MTHDLVTMYDQYMAVIQTTLDCTIESDTLKEWSFETNPAAYLANYRVAGVHIPEAFKPVDFLVTFLDGDRDTHVIIPNMQSWSDVKHKLMVDLAAEQDVFLKIVNERTGEIVSLYALDTPEHREFCKRIRLSPTVKVLSCSEANLHMVTDTGEVHPWPRGFTLQGRHSTETMKLLMTRQLGMTWMFSEALSKISNNHPLTPMPSGQVAPPLKRVVVFEARRFFDKARFNKFFEYLGPQSSAATEIIFIN